MSITVGVALIAGQRAQAQVQVADDVIVITKGARAKESARTHAHLGLPGESAFPSSPGSLEPRLGEPTAIHPIGVLSAAAVSPEKQPGFGERTQIRPAPIFQPGKQEIPLYGPLELPTETEEGPPNGLTLDAAIDYLVRENFDLKVKFQEIPKARADIISAGLRANPIVFAGVDNIPYRNPSERRPVETSYGFTVIQPWDWNQKRLYRVDLAQQAKTVLEAQFQNAIRAQIDALYADYVTVLQAREAVRAAEAGVKGMGEVEKITKKLVEGQQRPQTELFRAAILKDKAAVALEDARSAYAQAKLTLGHLLNLPPQQAACLEVRGSLQDKDLAVLCADDLIPVAQGHRPDLLAFRLGVARAEAGVRLAKAEKYEDIFFFYTPVAYNASAGSRDETDTTTYGVGVMVPLPLLNRNQGNIARAQINVAQVKLEVDALERQIITEVQQAVQRYLTSRAAVLRYRNDILASARKYKDGIYQSYAQGQVPLIEFLTALAEYNDVVRDYLQVLAGHRRNMLEVNTVVGKRILP